MILPSVPILFPSLPSSIDTGNSVPSWNTLPLRRLTYQYPFPSAVPDTENTAVPGSYGSQSYVPSGYIYLV